MSTLPMHVERLAHATRWGYRASREPATEPAAWTAIALAAHDNADAALRPAEWLAELQQHDGSLGVSAAEQDPRWPTSLALLAWCAIDRFSATPRFDAQIAAAVKWSLVARGKSAPRSSQVGHNTELIGWSWAADTHSWLEPTCLFVLALRAAGLGDHSRVREGVRLIVDRLLPKGGANYGNTIVLGQPLVGHVQPTGLAMLALQGEEIDDDRVEYSLKFLRDSVGPATSAASLSFACLGMTAFNQRPSLGEAWVAAALDDNRRESAAYEQALLLLAAQPSIEWIMPQKVAAMAKPVGGNAYLVETVR